MEMSNEGLRYDEGKVRFDLIPPEVLLALARLYSLGATKYASRNWEKGMNYSRVFNPLMRHLLKWQSGIPLDEESGEPHLAHVLWNVAALLVYEQREIGVDDLHTTCAVQEHDFKVQSKPLPEAPSPSLETEKRFLYAEDNLQEEAQAASSAAAFAPSAPSPFAQSTRAQEYSCSGACCAPKIK
jgi:hypothetical protein